MKREFRDTITKKIREIERDVVNRTDLGRLSGRVETMNFMVFLLFGSADDLSEDAVDILEYYINDMLETPNSCVFVRADEYPSPEAMADRTLKLFQDAWETAVDVADLNTVLLCPVIFCEKDSQNDYLPFFRKLGETFRSLGKQIIWQPYVIESHMIGLNGTLRHDLEQLRDFVTSTRPGERVNNCCILTTSDERGHHVPAARLMPTVAVTSVLLNAAGRGNYTPSAIQSCLRHEEGGVAFLTTRSVSVTYPARTLMLKHLIKAVDSYACNSDGKDTMTKINFGFLSELIMQNLGQLPHRGGAVDFLPLCAVMPGNGSEETIQELAYRTYIAPVCGKDVMEKLCRKALIQFFNLFFYNNGSLEELFRILSEERFQLIEQRGGLPLDVPIEILDFRNRQLTEFGKFYTKWSQICLRKLQDAPKELAAKLTQDLKDPSHREKAREERKLLVDLRNLLREQISVMENYELLLEDDPDDWFHQYSSEHPEAAATGNKLFDQAIYSALIGSKESDTQRYETILTNCYDSIRPSLAERHSYLSDLNQRSMDPQKAKAFFDRLRTSWFYTVRTRDSSENIFIVGDEDSHLFSALKRLSNAENGALEIEDYDRIDMLSISKPFAMEDIIELMGNTQPN